MRIKLVFNPPAYTGSSYGFQQDLTEAESNLVPHIGEIVRWAGQLWKLKEKIYTFHPSQKPDERFVEIEYSTEFITRP